MWATSMDLQRTEGSRLRLKTLLFSRSPGKITVIYYPTAGLTGRKLSSLRLHIQLCLLCRCKKSSRRKAQTRVWVLGHTPEPVLQCYYIITHCDEQVCVQSVWHCEHLAAVLTHIQTVIKSLYDMCVCGRGRIWTLYVCVFIPFVCYVLVFYDMDPSGSEIQIIIIIIIAELLRH